MSVYDASAVWLHSEQKGPRLLLLLAISDGIDKRFGDAQRTIEALANRARIHERSVQHYNNDLIAAGELIVIPNPGYQSHYAIPCYPGEEGYEPVICNDDSHDCNGWHTPLPYIRDEVLVEAAKRRKAANNRKYKRPDPSEIPESKRGGKITTPAKTTKRGGKITTPGWQDYHPPVAKLPPTPVENHHHISRSIPNRTQKEPMGGDPSVDASVKRTAPSWGQVMAWEQSDAGRDWYRHEMRGRDPHLLPSSQRFSAYEKAALHGEVQS